MYSYMRTYYCLDEKGATLHSEILNQAGRQIGNPFPPKWSVDVAQDDQHFH